MATDHELRLRERLTRLRSLNLLGGARVSGELEKLQRQLERIQSAPTDEEIWRSVELARHQDRPYTLDYVERLFEDWVELHGDRGRADDAAVVVGLGRFDGRTLAVLGTQKGGDIRSRTHRNFSMAYPEGYRKAMRVMELADRHGFPLISLVDIPGAYPGVAAEQHGQGGAIARSQRHSPTACSCRRTRSTPSSLPRGARRSSGAMPARPRRPLPRSSRMPFIASSSASSTRSCRSPRAAPTRIPTRRPGSWGNLCARRSKSSNQSRQTSSSADAEPNSARSAFTPESTCRVWIDPSLTELSVGLRRGRVPPLHNIHSVIPRPGTTSGRKSGPKSRPPRWVEKLFRRTSILL